MQRAFDEDGVITGDDDACAFWQIGRHGIDGGLHAGGNIERVGLRLTDDAKTDTLHAIGAQRGGFVIRTEHDGCHVAKADIVLDEKVGKVLRLRQARRGAHDDVLRRAFQRSRRHVECRAGQRVGNIGHGQTTAGECCLIEIDAKNLFLIAIKLDIGNAVDSSQAVDDLVIHQLGQIFHAERRRGDGKAHDRLAVGIRLDDLRLVGIIGQLIGDAADGVTHIVSRNGHVDIVAKFHRHAAGAELRVGSDGFDAADTRHRTFDGLRHFLVDRLRRSAFIGGPDADRRPVDVRQFAHLDANQSGEASHDQQRVEDRRQDRPAHEQCGESELGILTGRRLRHWLATSSGFGCSPTRTAPPSRTR
ncbi:hypothetical protein D3C80_337770 [compost metagenome]